jgi:PLP dependent protein
MSTAIRIREVRSEIDQLCQKYHININELKLLAVSKTHPVSAIQAAYDAGITEFGESYVQEAIDKIQNLRSLAIVWHFIGPIQSNKTRAIAHHFDWVQSVDREKILRRLNEQRPKSLPAIKICLQINYFEETQKKGAMPNQISALLELAAQLPNIELRGLMAIPPKTNCFETQLMQFNKIDQCFRYYQQMYPQMDTLSMGMSGDLEAAIASRTTMVRIGRAIFGSRKV